MSKARETLEKLIEEAEQELGALRIALRSLDRRELQGKAEGRFVDWRPLDAMRVVLQEAGGEMTREDLTATLVDGGIAVGKKRSHHNVRVSIDLNCKLGNLIEKNGMISLPQ